jgi:phenylalanyl-tRNA synthetase beta chain
MEISLSWLGEWVDLPPLPELVDKLGNAGVAVDAVKDPRAEVSGVVVGEVLSKEKHPQADKLSVCRVNDGAGEHTVVCGAANVEAGQRIAYARVGAKLPAFSIEKRAIRGVESSGMICSKSELGLEEKSDGIWVLPPSWAPGADIFEAAKIGPVLTLDITPNRPDLLSHVGVAREVAAASGQRLKPTTFRVTEKGPDSSSLARVLVEDGEGCKRYLARVVREVKIGPSPAWLRERLERVGQRSINNVVDATNYVLHELGQPMHAFDLAKINVETGVPTVRVRRGKSGEVVKTLDGTDRQVGPDDVIIADAKQALAIGGVMGGADSEVADGTTTLLLESAWFEPARIRRTSRRLGLVTESSRRFERGADPVMARGALDRCAQLLVEIAGGQVAKGILEVSQKSEPRPEIILREKRVPQMLGVDIATEGIVQLLEPLEIRCVARGEGKLRFEVPSFRPDLTREIDLIEEVARRHGLGKIPERLPDASGPYRYDPPQRLTEATARQALLAAGASETITYGFGPPALQSIFAPDVEAVRIKNPLGEEHSAMRTSLLPGLLGVLRHNLRHGAESVRLFEVGTTFAVRKAVADLPPRDQELPAETLGVSVVLYGGRHGGRWYEGENEKVDLSDLVGLVENLVAAFEPEAQPEIRPEAAAGYNPQSVGALYLGSKRLGSVGQLHPEVARRFEIPGLVFVAELSLTELEAIPTRRSHYAPLPRFPGTRRDVAVIADETVASAEIVKFLRERAGGELGPSVVEDVQLFDLYRGKPIPKGKTSMAFAIAYRHRDRTLTDDEVGKAFEGVLAALKERFALEIRSAT